MDYAKFLAMWLDSGVSGGRQLLSRAAVARTLTPVSTFSPACRAASRLLPQSCRPIDKLAVMHVRQGADPMVLASGGRPQRTDGTRLGLARSRSDRPLFHAVARQSDLTSAGAFNGTTAPPTEVRVAAADGRAYAPYVGSYVGNFGPFRNAEFRVRLQDGFLALDVPGRFVTELKEPDDHRTLGVPCPRPRSGVVRTRGQWPGGRDALARSSPALRCHVAAIPDGRTTVDRHTGYYEDRPRTLRRRVVNGELTAIHPRVAPFQFPSRTHTLRACVPRRAVIRFNENADGQVISYTVHAPDGTPRFGQGVRARRQPSK